MNPVNITAHRVDGGVDVMVETHDQWTLKAGVPGSACSAADASYRVDFEEENLFGWGKAVSVAYESDNERNSWSLGYFDPNVFNSRWRLNLVHATYSDGFHDEVVDRPAVLLADDTRGPGESRPSAGRLSRSPLLGVGVGRHGLHETAKLPVSGGAHDCPVARTSHGASSRLGAPSEPIL